METSTAKPKITLAFINDTNPILDLICNDLTISGFEIIFRSETIKEGLSQLSILNKLPNICVVDLDFYNKEILSKLQKLKTRYPTIKLIAHSDLVDDKVGKLLCDVGFSSCLLLGSDVNDFKRAIDQTVNGYQV